MMISRQQRYSSGDGAPPEMTSNHSSADSLPQYQGDAVVLISGISRSPSPAFVAASRPTSRSGVHGTSPSSKLPSATTFLAPVDELVHQSKENQDLSNEDAALIEKERVFGEGGVLYPSSSTTSPTKGASSSIAQHGPLQPPPTPGAIRFSRAVVQVVADSKISHDISMWSAPLTMVLAFIRYLLYATRYLLRLLWRKRRAMATLTLTLIGLIVLYQIDGSHQTLINTVETWTLWYSWWIVLGIASSIGLGTGLHTFILFLAPLIAKTTLTAYSCGSLDFDLRGARAFECANNTHSSSTSANVGAVAAISVWAIYRKVRAATMFWGFGTTMGELPPYFVAKAAAMAGKRDSSYISIESVMNAQEQTFLQKVQIFIHYLVKRIGFWGIFLCAAIPNPLFDVAGILCGHFEVPVLTFFGATFLGKTIVKSNVQAIAVILLFSQEFQKWVLDWLVLRSPLLHERLRSFVEESMSRIGQEGGNTSEEQLAQSAPTSPTSYLAMMWNTLLAGMVLFYVLRIIEALALLQLRHEDKVKSEEHVVAVKSSSSTSGGKERPATNLFQAMMRSRTSSEVSAAAKRK